MSIVFLMPVGVTGETVYGVLGRFSGVDVILTVTTRGYEDVKEEIVRGVREAARLMGAYHEHIVVERGDPAASARIYAAVVRHSPEKIIVSGITGSRFLYPILVQALLRVWHDTGAEVYLVHGVEGEEWSLVPFVGFYVYKLNREQRRLFEIIYSHPGASLNSRRDLFEKYGLSRGAYATLRELERKGLIRRRRNIVEKTYPGMLLYNLLKVAENAGAAQSD